MAEQRLRSESACVRVPKERAEKGRQRFSPSHPMGGAAGG